MCWNDSYCLTFGKCGARSRKRSGRPCSHRSGGSAMCESDEIRCSVATTSLLVIRSTSRRGKGMFFSYCHPQTIAPGEYSQLLPPTRCKRALKWWAVLSCGTPKALAANCPSKGRTQCEIHDPAGER